MNIRVRGDASLRRKLFGAPRGLPHPLRRELLPSEGALGFIAEMLRDYVAKKRKLCRLGRLMFEVQRLEFKI